MASTQTYERSFISFCCFVAVALLLPAFGWHYLVNQEVPEPYLDEVFHIRQAQTYCRGDLQTWDPKITTPPGLYLVNHVLKQLGVPCTESKLRLTNVLFLAAGVAPLAFIYRASWSASLRTAAWSATDGPRIQRLISDAHTALNVALFPPLFFFSGLYYTDVASTATVLGVLVLYKLRETYAHGSAEELIRVLAFGLVIGCGLHGQWTLMGVAMAAVYVVQLPLRPLIFDASKNDVAPNRKEPAMRKVIILVGIASLALRQTNIFWIAVFPAALSLLNNTSGRASGNGELISTLQNAAFSRTFFNPPIYSASVEDALTSILSMVSCIFGIATFMVSHPLSVQAKALLNKVAPYVSLSSLFLAFVLVNGGIVLGDKSNHIATIHLPQMLYVWPYILFFSAPLVLPGILGSILPTSMRPAFLDKLSSPIKPSLLSLIAAVSALAAFLGIIHFNTLIHPFTLADNRHYVFYVFRILRLHPELFYLAAPVYLVSAWMVIRTLGIPGRATKGSTVNNGPGLNFVVVWLSTIALCLVGAPLVEPRYYILPWILWRLEVPSPHAPIEQIVEPADELTPVTSASASTSASIMARESEDVAVKRRGKGEASHTTVKSTAQKPAATLSWQQLFFSDYRLWLETGWHLAINAATGYVFLYGGFEWLSEPGQVQRFLW